VPIGCVPRFLRVLARGPVTRQCSPGDIVQVTGIFMPAPSHGFQARLLGLAHETHLEAFKIVKDKECYSEFLLSDDMMGRVNDVKSQCADESHLF